MKSVNEWKQGGEIYLWRYLGRSRNFLGWHITGTKEGCLSLVELLDRFEFEGERRHRTIQLSQPSTDQLAVPNNANADWTSAQKLKIEYHPGSSEWRFPKDSNPAVLQIGQEWLEELRNGLLGIPEGKGDYSIGTDKDASQRLWFWWT